MKRKNAAPMSLKKLTLSLSLVSCFTYIQAQEATSARNTTSIEEAVTEQVDSLSP